MQREDGPTSFELILARRGTIQVGVLFTERGARAHYRSLHGKSLSPTRIVLILIAARGLAEEITHHCRLNLRVGQ